MYVSNTGFASVGSIKAVENLVQHLLIHLLNGIQVDDLIQVVVIENLTLEVNGNATLMVHLITQVQITQNILNHILEMLYQECTSVVLENNKVRAATSEDNVADIIGVVRPKGFGKNSMVATTLMEYVE